MAQNIVVSNGRATILVEQTLETLELESDLFVFRRSTVRRIVGNEGALKHFVPNENYTDTIQGFVDAENLKNIEVGNGAFETKNFYIFPDDLQEDIRIFGCSVFDTSRENGKKTGFDMIRKDVFTAFAVGEAGLHNLVEADFGNNVFFDYRGNALPVGLTFNYMNGGFSEDRYDLVMTANHLLTRTDVVLQDAEEYQDRRRHFGGPLFQTKVSNGNDAIIPIPYYNAEPGHTKQIVFRWTPTAEQYRQIYAVVGRKNMALSSMIYKAIFDLDLLGLRAAGAALFDGFYDTKTIEDNE